MPRYFIEVAYKGTNYSGFQKQHNANSIQAEVEKALNIFFRLPIHPSPEGMGQGVRLTGASRTDAGVHALQNFFHFDIGNNSLQLDRTVSFLSTCGEGGGEVYNLNAILPSDIVIKKIYPVKPDAHCRFDAIEREYKYYIYNKKDPFLKDTAYYFPFTLDNERLSASANLLTSYNDFSSFSKKNTQVNNFICTVKKSEWIIENHLLIYHVIANRFLRGMVKGLVGTMLKVAMKKITLQEFQAIIETSDSTKADFTPPSKGLFLIGVKYT